ncbi:hypothetical protein VTN00DRAFT_7109 [Thermoascus crustaceus]|uniref:uncharacterized protein n=1 Tax=Thermoascus crustaceus TaxID=5088 RepID=UPI003741F916
MEFTRIKSGQKFILKTDHDEMRQKLNGIGLEPSTYHANEISKNKLADKECCWCRQCRLHTRPPRFPSLSWWLKPPAGLRACICWHLLFAWSQGPFRNWLNYLYEPYYVKKLNNAFTAAAFLANQTWMPYNVQTLMGRSLTVASDPGVDTDVPVIYLTALLGISTYAYYYPRWTDTLDAFAMMRLGATIADKVPLLVTYRSDGIQALDEVPGWIGEAEKGEGNGEEEDIARLELGSHRVLSAEGSLANGKSTNLYDIHIKMISERMNVSTSTTATYLVSEHEHYSPP